LLKVDLAELLTVLMVSVVLTLLFDLPMQEVKAILMGAGKPYISIEHVELTHVCIITS
jgi:hypothetical protein